jgi:hypothetical protein
MLIPNKFNGYSPDGRRLYFMGGGGGGHTTSTVTQSNIPDWLRPQVEGMLGGATKELFNMDGDTITGIKSYTPYSQNPADYFAGFNQDQQNVFNQTRQMQTPGQFQFGSQYANMAGMGGLGSANQAYGYGGQAAGLAPYAQMYGQTGLDVGDEARQYARQSGAMGGIYEQMATNPNNVAAYMSPYMQNVTDVAKQNAIENAKISNMGANLGAARQGTYGGARQTLAQGQREAALGKQLNDIEVSGLQKAFEDAQKSQQFGVTAGLQGLQGAQQGLNTALSGGQLGLQGLGQAGNLFGIGLQGVQGAQAGYGLAGQAGANLANIGNQQQAADISRLGLQAQMGDKQQAFSQQQYDQAIQNYAMSQVYPQQQLSFYNSLLRGYATPTTTTNQYQASPSPLGQLAGIGTAAAGAYGMATKRAGGRIKEQDDGGIDELMIRRTLNRVQK